MFRKPRENASISNRPPLRPSAGRPPTPPGSTRARPPPIPAMAPRSSTKPLTPRPNSKSNMPANTKSSTKKAFTAKTPSKHNTSILSFFKKVDSPLKDDSIFLSQGTQANDFPSTLKPAPDLLEDDTEDLYGDGDGDRFNEVTDSVKKRKISNETVPDDDDSVDGELGLVMEIPKEPLNVEKQPSNDVCIPPPPNSIKLKPNKPKRRGPFLSDSESDYESDNKNIVASKGAAVAEKRDLRTRALQQPDDWNMLTDLESVPVELEELTKNPMIPTIDSDKRVVPWKRRKRVPVAGAQAKWEALQPKCSDSATDSSESGPVKAEKRELYYKECDSKGKLIPKGSNSDLPTTVPIPKFRKEATSVDEWAQFEDTEEFLDNYEFDGGEEFVERKWMEEQAKLEAAEGGEEEFNGFEDDFITGNDLGEEITPACPVCNASLGGAKPDEATRHVNGCLDGNPVPLLTSIIKNESTLRLMPEEANGGFARKAAIARPGQANPFKLGAAKIQSPSSAFSKLMSGHAEDAAWATAAATEQASRGKPAYQRTCPFYKVMPGFFICVDAFRYGAVQGCNAYFLSHFHSDHYVGLSSSWCHGPIYCSKVTANLVKQQLRVDSKWVVALNFEERFEVPRTQEVYITMIPANHCPGSSLFLFEKVIGKGSKPKVQRILHCGDFRACEGHIGHPLLMPDVRDSISGKTKQQKIDICYLDTTYLNPRYSFPSQEDVVKACADMCISLKKERAEESDAWETAKRERAGSGMAKFVKNGPAMKGEDDSISMEIGSSKNPKARGRLLVICGTYSIGKERICMGIARALDCKIWAPPGKRRICAALEDPELSSRLTDDPKEAQIHMQMLMEIRAETLQEYLNGYKPHFSRIVGFRPSGWNYRPPNSRFTDSPTVPTIIHSPNWRSTFTLQDLVPQRGSTREASCFGVPYSEHSSFRELTLFVCSLRIEKVIPTVNVGSAASRAKMKAWIERWLAERRKNGCLKIGQGEGEVRW